MKHPLRLRAFTLLELLTVIAIIAIVAALALPVFAAVQRRGQQTAGLSNIRQVGAAFLLYAGEHEFELPGRSAVVNKTDRWPKLLAQYIQDIRVYAAPGDPQNYLIRKADPVSNSRNNTSFILNGFNDLGTFENPSSIIRINRAELPSQTLLLGTPKPGSIHFFMDFLEPPHGNIKDHLDLKLYGDGSDYLFLDGSARFIAAKDYRDTLWLADKDYVIPEL